MKISHSADVTLDWPLTVCRLQVTLADAKEDGVPPDAYVTVHGPSRTSTLGETVERCRVAFSWETGEEDE